MIESPFIYEEWLTPADYQKIGELALRWSHIDHILGNCLKTMLDLSDNEAVIMVFPLSTDYRLDKIKKLAELKGINEDARTALDGLSSVMGYIQMVRNNVVHAVMVDDPERGQIFRLRSKGRSLTKEEILSVEEITNYAAHAVLALRYALGIKNAPGERHPLPDKPAIPDFLLNPSPSETQLGRRP
jgi:hypothetical protein